MNIFDIFKNNKDKVDNTPKHYLPKRFWTEEELGKGDYDKFFNDYLFGRCLTGAEFIELLDNNFTPFIKSLGFKGRKNHFYKVKDNLLFVIGLFKDKYGGGLTLNVGIHIINYPIRGYFEKTEISKITTNGTIIQKNLILENGNSWLKFGKDKDEGLETIEFMKFLVTKEGVSLFQNYEERPNIFNEIEISDFVNPTNKFQKYGIDEKMLKWIHFQIFVARFNFDYGDKNIANEILKMVRVNEFNSDRFTLKGISPLIPEIDKLINEWK